MRNLRPRVLMTSCIVSQKSWACPGRWNAVDVAVWEEGPGRGCYFSYDLLPLAQEVLCKVGETFQLDVAPASFLSHEKRACPLRLQQSAAAAWCRGCGKGSCE